MMLLVCVNQCPCFSGRYVDSASEVCSQQGLATASVHTIIRKHTTSTQFLQTQTVWRQHPSVTLLPLNDTTKKIIL